MINLRNIIKNFLLVIPACINLCPIISSDYMQKKSRKRFIQTAFKKAPGYSTAPTIQTGAETPQGETVLFFGTRTNRPRAFRT